MDYFLRHYWICFNIASVLCVCVCVFVLFFGPEARGIFSSPIRDQTCTPCNGSRSFNHWTTREVSLNFLNFKIFQTKRIKNKIIFTSLLFRLNIWLHLLQIEEYLYRRGCKSQPHSICSLRRGSILGSGWSPGGGHGNPLQYSCLENPMDRGAWRATVRGVTNSWTRLKRLSTAQSTSWDKGWGASELTQEVQGAGQGKQRWFRVAGRAVASRAHD